jgi:hypothetical protein
MGRKEARGILIAAAVLSLFINMLQWFGWVGWFLDTFIMSAIGLTALALGSAEAPGAKKYQVPPTTAEEIKQFVMAIIENRKARGTLIATVVLSVFFNIWLVEQSFAQLDWTELLSRTFLFCIFGFFSAMLAGWWLKGYALAFLVRQITLYTLHDTTAMLLAVHGSLVQAAESAGIDKHLLRPKEQFHGGRRDRLV